MVITGTFAFCDLRTRARTPVATFTSIDWLWKSI
ncbi:hypothetical protein RHRU231_450102 [Rhodococcus ruber]|uniref:Uncharacterized protein n=1 Tax=Rhodococcus ruber TaxID=1830 RepID=A0A098BL25_9NOCA|nr:hypothetical protein RHRU231_450102 [Rhodococcus ruber]